MGKPWPTKHINKSGPLLGTHRASIPLVGHIIMAASGGKRRLRSIVGTAFLNRCCNYHVEVPILHEDEVTAIVVLL